MLYHVPTDGVRARGTHAGSRPLPGDDRGGVPTVTGGRRGVRVVFRVLRRQGGAVEARPGPARGRPAACVPRARLRAQVLRARDVPRPPRRTRRRPLAPPAAAHVRAVRPAVTQHRRVRPARDGRAPVRAPGGVSRVPHVPRRQGVTGRARPSPARQHRRRLRRRLRRRQRERRLPQARRAGHERRRRPDVVVLPRQAQAFGPSVIYYYWLRRCSVVSFCPSFVLVSFARCGHTCIVMFVVP